MNDTLRLLTVALLLAGLLGSGLVARSEDEPCPWPPKQVSEYEFLKAHGLTQESFSIWLKEHSAWRRQYDKDLEQFSYIHNRDFETDRQGE